MASSELGSPQLVQTFTMAVPIVHPMRVPGPLSHHSPRECCGGRRRSTRTGGRCRGGRHLCRLWHQEQRWWRVLLVLRRLPGLGRRRRRTPGPAAGLPLAQPGPPAPTAPHAAAPTAPQRQPDRPAPPPAEPAGGFSYTIKAPPGRTVSLPPADPGGGWPPGPGGPAAGSVAVAAPPGTCPDCGTVNGEELRFCRKCGYQLFTPDPRSPKPVAARPVRRPWWQRWIPRSWLPDSDLVSGEARRAFRRSLPTGLRIRRYVGIAAVVALIGGLLFVVGSNPVRWVKDRIGDLRGSLSEVQLTVASEPPDAQVLGYPVEYVVDKQETAWATTWRPPGTAGSCVPPGVAAPAGSMGTLLLVLSEPTTVRALEIAAGLPESDQRRPAPVPAEDPGAHLLRRHLPADSGRRRSGAATDPAGSDRHRPDQGEYRRRLATAPGRPDGPGRDHRDPGAGTTELDRVHQTGNPSKYWIAPPTPSVRRAGFRPDSVGATYWIAPRLRRCDRVDPAPVRA